MAAFLLAKQVITANGTGPAMEVEPGTKLQLTMEILNVVEQESVEVRIEGSEDGETWMEKPLAAFPQKFYPGASAMLVSATRFIRARWLVNRWGRGSLAPRFELYLFAEPIASVALDSK
ncbi:MAG: hypothetical protein FJW36_22790 [Acidobacteria bacterium]|nr:hypothetical protein [Acidobacteriota bacterium]